MKTSKFDVNFEVALMLDVEIDAVCCPGRPAPPCQDPSSPAFSDPGDSEEIEEYTVRLKRINSRTGKAIYLDITAFVDDDEVEDKIWTEANRLHYDI